MAVLLGAVRQDSGRFHGLSFAAVTAKIVLVKPPIRLLGVDIDGTLLNPEFQISPADMAALRRAHAEGVEVVVVTGRRHTFALPIVQQLGFDLWVISSNGAITRSLAGRDFSSRPASRRHLSPAMRHHAGVSRQHGPDLR